MPLTPDWERLLAECPGAEDGFPPPTVGFGAIDVRRDSGFEATTYLLDLGVKYLTPDTSPRPDCFRLRFKYGALTGLRQSIAGRQRPGTDPSPGGREEVNEPHPTPANEGPTVAFRLGRQIGRWLR